MTLHLLMILLVMVTSYSLETAGYSPAFRNKKLFNLNGVSLKFAATHFPPHNILTLMSNGNYTDVGSTPFYFAWLTEKLNFTLSMIDKFISTLLISYDYLPNQMTKSQYGSLSDIALVLKVVEDKKFDGSSRFVIASHERMKLTDFAIFMWAESLAMVVPRPGEESRIFAFVHPFQPTVWLFIFIAGSIIIAFMVLFSRIYLILEFEKSKRKINWKCTIYEWISYYSIYVVNTMTNQGNAISLGRFSFRILVGVWILVATVLVNSYSGTVISYLTVPRMKPAINTFEDLLKTKDVELILLADTMTKKQILDSTHGALKTIADDIRQNLNRILNTIEEVNVRLKTERYAFGNSQSFSNNFIARQFQEMGKCRFKTTDPYSMTMFYSVPLQKDSEYTTVFKYALMELQETGLPEYWVKNSIPRARKCFEKTNLRKTAVRKPIQLNDLTGAFFILIVGVSLATLLFLVENITRFKLHTAATIEEK